jgi:FlaA1/EpsC-like NDP-sugar epimerase
MGEPVNILDLAKKVIRLSGRVPERDVPIEIIGPRPGEKIAEDVRDPDEERMPSGHPAISVTRASATDRIAVRRSVAVLQTLCDMGDEVALAAYLRTQAGRAWSVRGGVVVDDDGRVVPIPDLAWEEVG